MSEGVSPAEPARAPVRPETGEGACPTSPGQPPSKLRVNIALPEDFSLNQALSLFLLDSIPALNSEAPDYALDLISLIEGILEDPDVVLRAQLRKLKGQKVAELKAQGIEYDQRMEELEKLEHPKPKPEFFYPLFNEWSDKHPWVGTENIRLKSIAREMFEQFRSFADYIKIYELQRAEGVLLRHLNGVYKVLSQTVPDTAKTDPVREMEEYLRTMLRQVDSSLLDEWAKMKNPDYRPPTADAPEVRPPGAEEAAQDITRDTKAFTAAIRTRIFTFLRALANDDFEQALAAFAAQRSDGVMESGSAEATAPAPSLPDSNTPPSPAAAPWSAQRLRDAIEPFYAGHRFLSLEPEARNVRHTYVKVAEDRQSWTVQQILVDPDAHNDWLAEFMVDLAQSRAVKEPVLRLCRIGPVA